MRFVSGARNPSTSVFAPSQRPLRTTSVLIAPTRLAIGSISSTRRHQRDLERRRDARARPATAPCESDEVGCVARFERQVHRVQIERSEAGVVHDRRPRVPDRVADDAVERRVRPDAPELQVGGACGRPASGRAPRRRRRTSIGCPGAPPGRVTAGPRVPSRGGRDGWGVAVCQREQRQ